MLILTRRPGESIRIGDNITVTVTKIGRGQVGLAIDAPRETKILREELVGTPPKPKHAGGNT
jgi:carbon storage regulator